MSGYALLQMVPILALDGTLTEVYTHLASNPSADTLIAMVVNGSTAFLLNIVSFLANKKTSPLAMNIAGITKQILAIVLGIFVFSTPITIYSILGVGVTGSGIAWYTTANFKLKQRARAQQEVERDIEKHEVVHARHMEAAAPAMRKDQQDHLSPGSPRP